MGDNGTLLLVRELSTHFFTAEGVVKAVQEVGFSIKRGQTFALVGESGCGKTATALSIMRLLPKPQGKIVGGEIVFEGRNLLALSERQMRQVRGNRIAMIFQEPMTSLNPVFTVGNQIAEAISVHQKKSGREAWIGAVEMLRKVGIADPAQRARDYPHQMSGGMRQRVMIAMAVSCKPALLIADEPTTALDVTIQAQILDLLDELQRQNGMSILLITHNLGIVAQRADDVAVMYASRIVEVSDSRRPSSFVPRDSSDEGRWRTDDPLVRESWIVNRESSHESRATNHELSKDKVEPLLEVNDLRTYFPVKRGLLRRTVLRQAQDGEQSRTIGYVKAVDGISFGIRAGQTLGLVGESGCGKTTVARTIVRLVPATAGEVVFDGIDVLSANRDELQQIRRQVSFIFQDPYSSLNPRMTVGEIVGEPLLDTRYRILDTRRASSIENRESMVAELLSKVGLSPEHINRYPHEFSGGQRQRIAVARALAMKPRLVICDEPVSSLDVSIQSQILNLLKGLQEELALAYLFIAHDLAVVEFFCDIVAVMYMGKIVEHAEAEELYQNPLHPYTRELMSAIPQVKPSLRGRRSRISGELPSILSPPEGCPFHLGCSLSEGDCLKQIPILEEKSKGHFVACWKCKKIDY